MAVPASHSSPRGTGAGSAEPTGLTARVSLSPRRCRLPRCPNDGTIARMNWRRAWGLGCVALSLGAACTETPATPGTDAGPASDATSDAPATDAASGSCSLEPRLDLDRDGVTTPQGTAGWVEFSRASEAQQLSPIPTCLLYTSDAADE